MQTSFRDFAMIQAMGGMIEVSPMKRGYWIVEVPVIAHKADGTPYVEMETADFHFHVDNFCDKAHALESARQVQREHLPLPIKAYSFVGIGFRQTSPAHLVAPADGETEIVISRAIARLGRDPFDPALRSFMRRVAKDANHD